MPLTGFQRSVLALLATTRSPDSYLAGGAALHFAPNSIRYSNDLDFFHDSVERVAAAFAEDQGQRDPLGGYLLHEIDLAVNKVLVLSGRDEPRDYVDILFIHGRILRLGALCWAAAGNASSCRSRASTSRVKESSRTTARQAACRLSRASAIDPGSATASRNIVGPHGTAA